MNDEYQPRQILIEEDEQGRVTVTTNESTLDVAYALLLLKMAELNVMSYHLGAGQQESTHEVPV